MVRRFIEQHIEDPLAEVVLSNKGVGTKYLIHVIDEKIQILEQ